MRFEAVTDRRAVFPVIYLRDNETGTRAGIYAKGALLNSFEIPVEQGWINVVDGFESPEQLSGNITQGFRSAKLSPFVCRMRKGTYMLQDTAYTIGKYYLAGHAIHGLLYDADFVITDSFSSNEKATVSLEYHYEGTDPGYPFAFTMLVNWQLGKDNHLSVTTSVYHHNANAIPMADGWHPYFTLGGSVDACSLQFDSSVQLEYDADLLPTGKYLADERFRKGCVLQGVELDNSFELDKDLDQPKCVLENATLQLIIEPGKTYPLLQVYIPPHRNSIAIENLSGAPDNFNNGIGLILLQPHEQKIFRTSYQVKRK